MNFTLGDQLRCALAFYLCGLILGVVYDVFRFLRAEVMSGRAGVFILDVLFMILFALSSAVVSMAYSYGSTRYFSFFAQVCGVLTIRFTIGLISLKVLRFLFGKITAFCKKILIKSKKTLKKVLQAIRTLLYNKVKKSPPLKDTAGDA